MENHEFDEDTQDQIANFARICLTHDDGASALVSVIVTIIVNASGQDAEKAVILNSVLHEAVEEAIPLAIMALSGSDDNVRH